MTKKPTATRLELAWSDDEFTAIAPFAQAIIDARRAERPGDDADDETILQRFVSDAILAAAGQAQAEATEREWREQENARRLAAQERAEAARAVLNPQPDPEPDPAPQTDAETA